MQQLGRLAQLLTILLLAHPAGAQYVLTEGTNISADVSTTDGRIAIDLLGSIWIIDEQGGDARRINDNVLPARGPRWSPDGRRIVYQAYSPQYSQIWLLDLAGLESESLSQDQYVDQQPDWHPDGERVIFSSERGDSGFDLWELDLASRLSWRISNQPGDETHPAWSGNGRHLAYIHRRSGQWSLVLRRFGQPDEVLFVSASPLYAPSWRPDGSLLTFLQQTPNGLITQMAILSEPPLVRPLITGEDFFVAPVSWLDRQRFFYTANGGIKTRRIDDWQSTRVQFAATIEAHDRQESVANARHQLEVLTPSHDRLVIRSSRLFDGSAYQYSHSIDVEIADGRIASMLSRREWSDAVILDLGNVTLLPGFIDSFASLSGEGPARIGAELLAYGVTTVVSADRPDFDPRIWESANVPGPRLLRAAAVTERPETRSPSPVVLATLPAAGNGRPEQLKAWKALGIPLLAESWTTGLGQGADLLMAADSLPTSPRGLQYQDIQLVLGFGPVTLLSGLASASTPGLMELMQSRQAVVLGRESAAVRRNSVAPQLSGRSAAVVLGSRPSGLPAGLALHAEFRALEAAGLSGDQVLKSAGIHAARVLGLEGQVGQIHPGAVADLVLVSGDPLHRAADTLNVVAVIRNGRFYSLSSLLERAAAAEYVE